MGILLFLNSGSLLAHKVHPDVHQENSTFVSKFLYDTIFTVTVKSPVKEDLKKGIENTDNEIEEEEEVMITKKSFEKSNLVSNFFTLLSPKHISTTTNRASFYDKRISISPSNSLYILFEVFRI